MKKRWLIVLAILVWTVAAGAGGYAMGQCPERTAKLSEEAVEQIAEACVQATPPCPDCDCPDPCPDVPQGTCPETVAPDCPEQESEVLILPTYGNDRTGYRLEALLLAGEESWGAGAVWRPHRRLWRLTAVGVVYQDIDAQEASYGLSGAYPCWEHGHHQCGGWEASGVVRSGGTSSLSVVATIGLF